MREELTDMAVGGKGCMIIPEVTAILLAKTQVNKLQPVGQALFVYSP